MKLFEFSLFMTIKSLLFTFSVTLFMSGCGTTPLVELHPVTNTQVTDQKTSYILFAVQSQAFIERIEFDQLVYLPGKINHQNAYILAPVPEGTYQFKTIKTGFGSTEIKPEDSWRFQVEPGQINYVGHIEMLSLVKWCNYCFRAEIANKSSFALEHIEQHYPELLSNQRVVYKGPGEDPFLEFAQGGLNPSDSQLSASE